jgi:hypothetical protein
MQRTLHILIATTICLLAIPTLHAASPTKTLWRAQWIWAPKPVQADTILARKTFTLDKLPNRAKLSITASSRYQLKVNGKHIGTGPARCAPHHQSYDTLDITSALQQGLNVIAVRVHHQREGVSFYGPSRAGLLAQLDFPTNSKTPTIQTDNTWRITPDKSWLNTSPRIAMYHLQVADRVDMRQAKPNWQAADYNDKFWPRAHVLRRETGWPLPQPDATPTHLIPPWTSLTPRDIPYLNEHAIRKPPHHIGALTDKSTLELTTNTWHEAPTIAKIILPKTPAKQDKNKPIRLSPNMPGQSRLVIYDLGEAMNARPFFDIQAPADSVVDVVSAPYLIDGAIVSPIVNSHYVDRVVLSGRRDRWGATYEKPVRWLALVFRHLPGDAQLFDAGAVRVDYPFKTRGRFQTPDAPQLQALWHAAAKTIRVCTTDAYTDNYRERRQYAQTSYYAALGAAPVFGDHDLQRRYLLQVAQEQLPDGLTPAYAPRHGNDFMVILDSNCLYIRGLHDYLLRSGDKQTTRQLLPHARQLLDLLHSYTNNLGLIDNPPQPYWLDHANLDRRGANFLLNAHYLGALEDFAQTLDWLDQTDASIYRQRAAQARTALREKLWNPQHQLFADALINDQQSDRFSEHTNGAALALKIATPKQAKAIAQQLTVDDDHDFIHRESGLVMVTPAMSYYLHAGLAEYGYADDSWRMLWSRFRHMLETDPPQNNGTLWEEWWLTATGRRGRLQTMPNGRSDAQTESAFMPGLFTRYILGLTPTQPGYRQALIRFYPSTKLNQRHGVIPTPQGPIQIDWQITPGAITLTTHAPPNVQLQLDMQSLNPTASPQLINLPPGKHTLRVPR